MKYKHNMQNLQSDCGIAATTTVLEQLKIHSQDISNGFKDMLLTYKGLSMENLINILEKFNIQASCYLVDDMEELKKVNIPFIMLANRNGVSHYLVVHNYDGKKKKYTISDPSQPDITYYAEKELEEVFLNHIVAIDKRPSKVQAKRGFFLKRKKVKTAADSLYKSVISDIETKAKLELFLIVFFQYLLPIIFYQILQNILNSSFEIVEEDSIIYIVIFYSCFFIASYLLSVRRSQLRLRIENTLQERSISEFYESNIYNLDAKDNINNIVGYLMTLMQNTSGLTARFFLLIDIVYAVFLIILLSTIHFSFPIIFISILSMYIFFIKINLKRITNYQKNSTFTLNDMLATFEENVVGGLDIRVYQKNEAAKDFLNNKIQKYFTARYQEELIQNKLTAFSSVSGFAIIFSVLAVTFVTYKFFGKELYPMTSGIYVFFVIIGILEGISNGYLSYKMCSISTEYIQKIKGLTLGVEKPEQLNRKVGEYNQLTLQNLSFSYANSEFVLKDINLVLSNGTITSIKGNNGSGKTTITRLLAGLLQPNAGKIYLDGKEYSSLADTNILESINFYSPEEHIFFGNVHSNITMDIHNNAQMNKYESIFSNDLESNELVFSNGTNISQGQKQKIILNRCMNRKDTSFVILDEPSGNLDYQAKADLLNHLKKLKDENKMILLITHDQLLINESDYIYTLKGGELISE